MPADPHLAELGVLRRKIDDGYDWLCDHATNATNVLAGQERFQRRATEYVTALQAWRQTVDDDDLRELRTWYVERLTRGWELAESPEVVEQFGRVLKEYEAVCDAIRGIDDVAHRLSAHANFILAGRRQPGQPWHKNVAILSTKGASQ